MTNPTDVHHSPAFVPPPTDDPDPRRRRHRASLVESVRRAWMQRNWPKLAEYAAVAVLLLGGITVPVGWGWSYAFAGSEAPPSPTAVTPTRPVDEAEKVFLRELYYAGIQLTLGEQDIAVEIAREHVAHGHLIGMRHVITDDFLARIPRLTTEERDIARIAVEHHFQAVTGRKQ